MKKFMILWCVALLCLLSGCAGTRNVGSEYEVTNNNDKGLMVATITLTRKTSTLPSIHFTNINTGSTQSITFDTNPFTRGLKSNLPGRSGKLVMIELPAGKYQITDFRFHAGAVVGYAYVDMSCSNPRTVSFEILPGKATYSGDLVVDDKGGFYSGVEVQGLSVRDNYENDRALFLKAVPGLEKGPLEKRLFELEKN